MREQPEAISLKVSHCHFADMYVPFGELVCYCKECDKVCNQIPNPELAEQQSEKGGRNLKLDGLMHHLRVYGLREIEKNRGHIQSEIDDAVKKREQEILEALKKREKVTISDIACIPLDGQSDHRNELNIGLDELQAIIKLIQSK